MKTDAELAMERVALRRKRIARFLRSWFFRVSMAITVGGIVWCVMEIHENLNRRDRTGRMASRFYLEMLEECPGDQRIEVTSLMRIGIGIGTGIGDEGSGETEEEIMGIASRAAKDRWLSLCSSDRRSLERSHDRKRLLDENERERMKP